MAITSAFDVAGTVLRRATDETLSPLKLQKLVFYSFGWFGHLTGERLFDEDFYAMKFGPVVSPLLSAHYGMNFINRSELEEKQSAHLSVDDPYASEVIDAVWSSYGRFSHSSLVEMTHCERPWSIAWNEKRPHGFQRADLDSDDIVQHFARKSSAHYEFNGRSVDVPVVGLLPDRRRVSVSSSDLSEMDSAFSIVPAAHVAQAADLRRRFLNA
jgi:uncharacterized phage-associated protein